MSLRLDVYVKRKGIDKKSKFLDLRRFRESKNEIQLITDKLYYELSLFGLKERSDIVNDLLKVPNINNLNLPLLITAYLYFSKKNFDPGNIILNFDEDFKEVVNNIKERGTFDLEKKIYLLSVKILSFIYY